MRFEKGIVCYLGMHQSLKLAISDASDFRECDVQLVKEMQRLDIPLNDRVKNVLEWDIHQ